MIKSTRFKSITVYICFSLFLVKIIKSIGSGKYWTWYFVDLLKVFYTVYLIYDLVDSFILFMI